MRCSHIRARAQAGAPGTFQPNAFCQRKMRSEEEGAKISTELADKGLEKNYGPSLKCPFHPEDDKACPFRG